MVGHRSLLTFYPGFPGSELPQHYHSVRLLCGLLCDVSTPGAELCLFEPKKATAAFFTSPLLSLQCGQLATLATLALCCQVPLGWMSLWLIRQYHQVPPALVVLGGTGLVTVSAMSISTGVRILVSDVLQSQPFSLIPGCKETRGTRTCDSESVARDDSTLSLKE